MNVSISDLLRIIGKLYVEKELMSMEFAQRVSQNGEVNETPVHETVE